MLPIAQLPDSELKDVLTGMVAQPYTYGLVTSVPRPGAAIVQEYIYGPVFQNPAEPQPPTFTNDLQAIVADEILLVVALLTDGPQFPIAKWFQPPHTFPLLLGPPGHSTFGFDPIWAPVIEPRESPIEEIETLVGKYRKLGEATRQDLRVPFRRLNQARRTLIDNDFEGAAIDADAGICAECLLTSDRQHDEPIAATLRTRGTLLLGGAAAERTSNHEVLRDL